MAPKRGETPVPFTAEEARLAEADAAGVPWRQWGPYLSERQWGTVREDYSTNGDAWSYFTHDQARSRAYRWGEDGIAGISDDRQRLCLALALWNGADPILKERLFGLTNSEGNHGEDVKEYYFFLDAAPTHSYLRELYKYPQTAYPYDDLVRTNRERSREEMEYELLDTGVFDDNRYFDVEIEYAKAGPTDLLMRVTAHNRGPQAAPLHLLPTLWFRNTWWQDPLPQRDQSCPRGRGAVGQRVPEGRDQRSPRSRHAEREPRSHRHQGGRPLGAKRPLRRLGHRAGAAHRRRRGRGRHRRRLRRRFRPAQGRV